MATKRMLIDASHPEETRVVVLNGNRVEDFDVEVESRRQLKGNVYLAKVTRVEPSLQAAFVEYGGNRHGFLAFSEIHPDYYQIPVADREALIAEEEVAQRAAREADDALDAQEMGEGVEEVGGTEDDMEDPEKVRRPSINRHKYKIQEVIKRRQILLIQVVKEERGNKGAALTTYLSLAGRYCVLMPNTARGGGISRKIASGQDRKRLKSILSDLGIPDGMAVIVRTAGDKRTKVEIKRDYEYLIRLWEMIRQKTLESIAPSLIHEEGNLIKRSIRDIYTKDLEEVIVDGEEGYRTAKDFMKLMMPSHSKRVQPYKETNIPLLQRFGVEAQIDSMHMPEVQLKSGGYIVINSTEALVAIDVNSGRSTRERNIEETAYKTNLEAADEVARQLRLRDLAGLIVIDFIDMENHRNQAKVERALKDAMRNDRARIQIGRISPFGLLEMSRQRLRPSLQEIHTEPCPHCAGTGIRRSADTTALHILRVIEEEAMRKRNTEITMHVPTEVALFILNYKREMLGKIETDYELKVYLESDDTLIPPDYRMDRVRTDGKTVEALTPESVAAQNNSNSNSNSNSNTHSHSNTPAPAAAASGDEESESEEANRKRRRRRGRRRGRRDEETPVEQNATAGEAVENEDAEAAEQGADENENPAVQLAEGEDADGDAPKRPRRRRRGRRAGRRKNRTDEEIAQDKLDDAAAAAEAGTDAPESDGDSADSETAEAETAEADAADTAPAETMDATEADAPSDEDAVAEKPKRKPRARRPRKTAADAAKAEPVASEPQDATTTATEAPAEVASEPVADEVAAPVAVSEPKPANDFVPEVAEVEVPKFDTAKTTIIDVAQIAAEEKKAKRGWWRKGS
jgi:ribonuclease E